jgi:methyl-accepting chemotaxis protein
MRENQKRVNIYLPMDLYSRCTQSDQSLTELIIEGLELVLNQGEIKNEAKINDLKEHTKIKDKSEIIETIKPEINQEMKELHQEIVNNLKENLKELYKQLQTKDEQIKNLNETLQNQVLNIHTLANTKLLPPAKKWYEFWK